MPDAYPFKDRTMRSNGYPLGVNGLTRKDVGPARSAVFWKWSGPDPGSGIRSRRWHMAHSSSSSWTAMM